MKLKNLLTTTLLSTTLLVSTNCLAATPATTTSTPLTPAQVQQIQQVVHDYLLKNPALMVQVFQKLQQEQQQQMQQQATKAIHANADAIFNDTHSPVAGNPNGSITLVEFFDYQCPHCKAMAATIKNLISKDKNLKVVFKEFPIFPGSMYAAQAALAAQAQGKYWEFHNALMADDNPLTKKDVLAAAKKVGLNMVQLLKDIDSATVKNELQQNEQLSEKLSLAGTPAFIIQNNSNKNKTFFVPGQIGEAALEQLIQKAS